MSIIEAKNLSYSYDKKRNVVNGVTFSVKKGEFVCVIGHNGSGKSTLSKLLNALFIPDSGELSVCGLSPFDKKNLFEIRKRVGVVFQNPDNQIISSIVEDDVAFGPENLGIKREEIKERIDYALSAVNMKEYLKASPQRLSGGQKQRIAIAGVLALKPEILVLDESTSMLDPLGRKEINSIVKKLNKEENVTVINVTHYMDEVVDADKVIVLSEGKIVMQGTPKEIFARKDELLKLNLELPLAYSIAEKLKDKGVNLPEGILTKERLLEELCKL